jgi:hypothetical protein
VILLVGKVVSIESGLCEMGKFEPKISSPGSIGLFLTFSVSLLFTLIVIIFLLLNRTKTASSRLVLLMNISMAAWTISKLPFVYSGFLCQVTGFIINYSVIQILLITYFLLTSTNIANLISNSEIQKASECRLDNKSLLLIFIVPFLLAIFPFTISHYRDTNGFCLMDHDSPHDVTVIFVSFTCIWICQLIVLYQLYKVLKKIWDYPPDVFYQTIHRVIYGPALYASYTTFIFICIDVVLISAVIYHPEPKSEGDYYLEYAYAILQYVLGLGYAAIYFFEKDNLQVTQPLCLFVSLSLYLCLSLSLSLSLSLCLSLSLDLSLSTSLSLSLDLSLLTSPRLWKNITKILKTSKGSSVGV